MIGLHVHIYVGLLSPLVTVLVTQFNYTCHKIETPKSKILSSHGHLKSLDLVNFTYVQGERGPLINIKGG